MQLLHGCKLNLPFRYLDQGGDQETSIESYIAEEPSSCAFPMREFEAILLTSIKKHPSTLK